MLKPIDQLCELVATVGVRNANKIALRFGQALFENTNIAIDDKTHETIVAGFSFMNWAMANGIWSCLKTASVRRDLLTVSKDKFVLKLAMALRPNEDVHGIAYLAANIEESAKQYYQAYIRGIADKGNDADLDANDTLFFTFEWIQKNVNIPDTLMNAIVPTVILECSNFSEIEDIACQVLRAQERRERG